MFLFQFNTWGVFIGSIVGVLLSFRFGIFGLFFGIYLGNKLDQAILKQQRSGKRTRKRQFWTRQTIALSFQLFGHLAKFDGAVSKQSIAIVESCLEKFGLSQNQQKLAKQSFNLGKEPGFNYYTTIQQLQIALMMHPSIKSAIANIVTKLVDTDPRASEKKQQRLAEILRSLGIIRFNSQWQQQQYQQHRNIFSQNNTQSLGWAYQVLGVSASTPITEVKRKYRKMLSDNHPDRLHAKGKPSESALKQANEKTIDIKRAYQLIKARFEPQTS